MRVRLKNKKASLQEWNDKNPILLDGELAIVVEAGTFRIKIGDGVTAFTDLPYTDILTSPVNFLANTTLLATDWDPETLTQVITIQGIDERTSGTYYCPFGSSDEQISVFDKANIKTIEQGFNYMTLKCFGEVPTIDIPIEIEIRNSAGISLTLDKNKLLMTDSDGNIVSSDLDIDSIPSDENLNNLQQQLEAEINTKANAADLTSHTSNTDNPHDVTLSQLGVSVTSTELNYVDGVTSNIQTQLDNKDVIGSAEQALSDAKSYTNTKISELINGAPTTLDTLGEIANAMAENDNVVTALESAIGTKANATDLTSHTDNNNNPHDVTLTQLGVTATSEELNYLDGVTSNIQEQLNSKAILLVLTSINLEVESWSGSSDIFTQTVAVNGVKESPGEQGIIVVPSPEDDNMDIYQSSEIKCISQAENSLTFQCKTKPTSVVIVNIMIFES